MKKLLAFSRSRLLLILFCLAFFAQMFLCTHWTDLIADDYRYCFSYADDTRIESVAQIFPSMAAHRQSMNGRVVPHFLVQLFLMLPKGIFDAVNALFFVLLIWLLHELAVGRGLPNPVLACALFFALWAFQPDFGQVFLWLTGAVNYLWCGVFSLLWLLPLVKSFRDDWTPGKALTALYVVFSFPVGAYSENGTVALVAMWLAFALVDWIWFKHRPALWKILALAAMLAGFAYMMSAPAETVNKSAEMTFKVLLSNFAETRRMYLRFWPLLVCFPVFYALAVYRKVDLKTRLLSLVLLFGSLAGQFVLTFAMYSPPGSTTGSSASTISTAPCRGTPEHGCSTSTTAMPTGRSITDRVPQCSCRTGVATTACMPVTTPAVTSTARLWLPDITTDTAPPSTTDTAPLETMVTVPPPTMVMAVITTVPSALLMATALPVTIAVTTVPLPAADKTIDSIYA